MPSFTPGLCARIRSRSQTASLYHRMNVWTAFRHGTKAFSNARQITPFWRLRTGLYASINGSSAAQCFPVGFQAAFRETA